MPRKTFTTTEAAAKIGLSRETVYSWLRAGKIPAPQQIRLGKKFQYLWTEADIENAKKAKGGKA